MIATGLGGPEEGRAGAERGVATPISLIAQTLFVNGLGGPEEGRVGAGRGVADARDVELHIRTAQRESESSLLTTYWSESTKSS